MNQKVQELRGQIALLDLQVTELQSLQNIVRVKRDEATLMGAAKMKKVKTLVASKLEGLPPSHPKRKSVADKLAEMQLLSDQRVVVIQAEYDSYQTQIDTLNDRSASLTKEMLTFID